MKRKPNTHCADKLKVLAEQARLSVLEILMDGPRNVGQLRELLRIEQSLLSHHLKVLREEGLVQVSRQGKNRLYRIADAVRVTGEKHTIDLGCCRLSFD